MHIPRFGEQAEKNIELNLKKAKQKREQSEKLYADAESLLASELGLDKLDLSESLFNVKNVSAAQSAERIDAEYFSEKYYRLENAIRQNRYSSTELDKLIGPIKNGFDYREFVEEGTPYIRVGDVRGGRITLDNAAKIPINSDEIKKNVKIKIADVLFTRKGTFGNAAVVRAGQDKAIISSEIMLLRLLENLEVEILPDYLALFLNSTFGYQQVNRRVHGVAYYSISQPDLASVLILLPPLKIQERLAEKVQLSLDAEQGAKRLLAEAKEEVEKMIEG